MAEAIQAGPKFSDASKDIHNLFETACTIPAHIVDTILPKDNISVLRLIQCNIPAITRANLPPLDSYFSLVDRTSPDAAVLRSLEIPPLQFTRNLRELAGEAWFSSRSACSVVYAHTNEARGFPFWILTFWERMAEISAAVHCWTAAERWLTSKEKVRVERTRKAARDFRVQLFTLPWQGHTHGFSDQEPVRIISAFCSRDWLSDAHENFFLELLRRDIASDPNSAFVTEIVLTWFTRSILKAYSGRASADYAAQRDSGVGALVRLGLDIEAGRTHSLGTIAHIHSNHWVGLIIDILTHAVLFGDPLGHDPPDDLKAAINWWLEQHTFSPYTWGVLPCTAQDDTHSCGVLTPNCIGHHYLPAKYPLIPSSQLEIDAARMEIGIEVLLQHKNALPIPIIADFSVQHEAAQFTFTSSTSTSKSPPRTPTRTGVADVLAVSFSALKVTPRVHEGALRSPTFSPSPSPVHPTWPVAAPKAKRHRQAVSPALSPEEKKKKKARSDALPTFAPLFAKAKAGAEKVKAAAKRLEGNLPSNPNASLSAPAKLSKAARAKTVAATKLPAKMRHKRARDESDLDDEADSDQDNQQGILSDDNEKPLKSRDAPRGRGRPETLFLRTISRPCHKSGQPNSKRYRCLGENCGRSWVAPRNRTRILKHACHCHRLPVDARREANRLMSEESVAAKLHGLQEQLDVEMGDSVPLAKRAKVEKDPSDRSSVSDGPRTQMDIVFGEHGRKLLQARLDFAIIKLICVAGIPPSIATYQEWREVFSIANSSYQPVSRSTLEDSHIPGEAARVRQETYKYLDTQYDLTISFDGGTIRRPQSVYTVHVTTADGRSFLLEGEEASGDSHTSEHIKQTVLRVINMIGRTHISGLASDSTNNAKTCRRLVCEEIRTIINMPDGPHHMSLTCKDICSLPMFKEVIRQLRATITFFRKSTHGTTHLTLERKKLEIPRGIESIGKTRFATICLSAISLERCLVPIRTLVHNSTITIKKNNHLFVKNSVTGLKFEMELTQLISILKPIAKSIACIESSMTTPADVYLFWLAILGSAKRLLDDPEAGFSSENAGQIRAILNTRFREQIEEGPSDCYISAFYLDPHYVHSRILKKRNPLTITITIPARPKPAVGLPRDESASPATAPAATTLDTETEPTIPNTVVHARVRKYLATLVEAEWKTKQHPVLGTLTKKQAKEMFDRQFDLYGRLLYPFDAPVPEGQSIRIWWCNLSRNPAAAVLASIAKKLYSVHPTSMADERTVSSFTWMNGGLRNRQEVRTLVDMTQIRQWHRHDPKKAEKIQRPTVKFYDLTEDIFGAIKSSAEVPPLENSSLYVDEDEEEVDDDSPGWTDDTLMIEEPADDFGSLEGDVDLDAPELVDVLADVGPQTHVEGNGATTPDHSDAGNGGMSDVEHSDDDADWGEW